MSKHGFYFGFRRLTKIYLTFLWRSLDFDASLQGNTAEPTENENNDKDGRLLASSCITIIIIMHSNFILSDWLKRI